MYREGEFFFTKPAGTSWSSSLRRESRHQLTGKLRCRRSLDPRKAEHGHNTSLETETLNQKNRNGSRETAISVVPHPTTIKRTSPRYNPPHQAPTPACVTHQAPSSTDSSPITTPHWAIPPSQECCYNSHGTAQPTWAGSLPFIPARLFLNWDHFSDQTSHACPDSCAVWQQEEQRTWHPRIKTSSWR